jgi:hypothetical protein
MGWMLHARTSGACHLFGASSLASFNVRVWASHTASRFASSLAVKFRESSSLSRRHGSDLPAPSAVALRPARPCTVRCGAVRWSAVPCSAVQCGGGVLWERWLPIPLPVYHLAMVGSSHFWEAVDSWCQPHSWALGNEHMLQPFTIAPIECLGCTPR